MNEELLDVFYIDEESPTWLSYAIDRLPKKKAGDHAGRISDRGYPTVQWEKKFYHASRIVWALRNHEWLNPDEQVYLIDRNPMNLSPDNMIPLKQTVIRYLDNLANNYPGYVKTISGYLPSVQFEGKRIYSPNCQTPEEAHETYRKMVAGLITQLGYGFLLPTVGYTE